MRKRCMGTIVSLVAGVSVIHACGGDSTGPTDIDPAPAADAVEGVAGSLDENEALRSLTALGILFPDAIGATSIVAASDIGSPSLARALRTLTTHMATVVLREPMPHLFDVIPGDARGRTYVYEPEQGYVASDRTGAPVNGVRFILYAINVVTREPFVTVEIGHVDLLDLSNASGNRLQVVVVSEDETLIEYDLDCTVTADSASLSADGFIADGETRADLDLSLDVSVADGIGGGFQFTSRFDFDVQVLSENVALSLDATEVFDTGDANSLVVDAVTSVQHGSNTIEFEIELDRGDLDGRARINGIVVAVISGTDESANISSSEAAELETERLDALARIFTSAQSLLLPMTELLVPAIPIC